MIVAVTGHRPQHLKLEDGYWIQGEFERLIEKLKPTRGLSGMAIGADTWWAQELIYAKVPLHAYVPFPGQENRWREDDQLFYRKLLAQAEQVFTIYPEYHPAAFHQRNITMVDACDLLIAAWNGKRSGGTFHALSYAEKMGKPIILVDPVRRVTTRRVPKESTKPLVKGTQADLHL